MIFERRLRELSEQVEEAKKTGDDNPDRYVATLKRAVLLCSYAEKIADLAAATREYLEAEDALAKAQATANVALENYTNPKPEVDKAGKAMLKAFAAKDRLQGIIDALDRGLA